MNGFVFLFCIVYGMCLFGLQGMCLFMVDELYCYVVDLMLQIEEGVSVV